MGGFEWDHGQRHVPGLTSGGMKKWDEGHRPGISPSALIYLHLFLPLPPQDLGAAEVDGLIRAVIATGVTKASLPNLRKKLRRVCSALSSCAAEISLVFAWSICLDIGSAY